MQVVGSITHHSTHLKAFLQREDRQVHCEKMLLWEYFCVFINKAYVGFPGGSDSKECNAGDPSSIPELGRSPGEGNGYLLQCSGLENSRDCTVHGVTKSRTWLSDFHFQCVSGGSSVVTNEPFRCGMLIMGNLSMGLEGIWKIPGNEKLILKRGREKETLKEVTEWVMCISGEDFLLIFL